MGEEERWAKVRQIVREELAASEMRVVAALQKQARSKIGFRNGQFTGIGEVELEALMSACPAVDVQKEIKNAAAWIVLNPADAPVSNFGKFLNTWMRKEQDKSSIRAISRPAPTAVPPKVCSYCPAPSTGSTSGYEHCRAHSGLAMDGEKPPRIKMA